MNKGNPAQGNQARSGVLAATEPAARQPRRFRLLRKLIRLVLALILLGVILIVAGVFYLKSEHCLRTYIFPAVSREMGRDVAFSHARIRLLRGFEISGFTIGPKSGEPQPMVKAEYVSVAWSLPSLVRGRVKLHNVTADGLEVALVEKEKRRDERAESKKPKKKSEDESQGGADRGFLIEELSIKRSSFETVRLDPSGKTLSRYAIRDFEAKGANLGLGHPAELDLKARIEASEPAEGVNLTDGAVACNIQSEIHAKAGAFSLAGDWAISRLKGQFHGVEAGDLRATGSLQIEQEDPHRMNIQRADAAVFYQGRPGAHVAATGEMDPATADGKFTIAVRGVNKAFLNLLSTPDQPLDFRNTTADARFVIETSQQAKRIAVAGEVDLADFSVVAPQVAPGATPVTQVTVRSKMLYDSAANQLELEQMDMKAVQEGRDVVTTRLSKPMTLSLATGGAAGAGAAADLSVRIDRLALAQLNPLLARQQLQIESGIVTLDSALSVGAGGQPVNVRGDIALSDLRGAVSGSKVGRTDLTADYDVTFSKGVTSIKKLACDVKQEGKPAGHIEGRGEIALDAQKGEIVLSGDRIDLSALQMLLANVPGVRIRSGLVDFDQRIAFAGPQSPLRFNGRFDATDLNFAMIGNDRAKFAGWSIRGGNALSFDQEKQVLDLTSVSLTVAEQNLGRLRAVAKGRLATAAGEGKLSLDVREAGVPFLISVLDRMGAQTAGPVKPTDGVLMASANVAFAEHYADVSLDGSLRTQRLQWTVGEGASAQRSARDLESQFDLVFTTSKERNALAIRDFLIRVTGGTAQAGNLRVKGQVDLAKNTGEVSVQFERFDTAPLLTLAGPLTGEWRPLGGILHGQQKITFAADGEISASGLLRAEQVRILPPKAAQPMAPPTIEIEDAVTVLRSGKELQADRFSMRLFKDAVRTGSLDVTGRVDLEKNEGALSVAAVNFETDSIWPLLASLGTDLPVTGGRLNGKQEMRFASSASLVEAKGNLRVESIHVRAAAGKPPIEPLTFDVNNDLTLTADKTNVRSLRLATYSGGKALDQIDLTAQGGGLKSKQPMNVTLKAPALHLDPYLAMLSGGGESGGAKSPSPPKSAKQSVPPKAAAKPAGTTFDVPDPPIRATLNVGKFDFNRLTLDNMAALVVTSPQSIFVQSFTTRIADGAASATFRLQTNVPGLAWNGTLNGRNLSVSPLVGLASPGSENKATGKGTVAVSFSGRGFDSDALQQNLRSDGAFRISDGQLKDIPILSALASVTNVEQLSNISFTTFDARWKIEKAIVHIADATAVGRLQKLRTRGTVGFDQNVDLTFDLWLGGELKDRLKDKSIFRYMKTEADRYLFLPVPIGMGGTLSKPRPTLNLPVQSLIDIGIEQGMKRLKEREEKKKK